jgi:hypothetical protein
MFHWHSDGINQHFPCVIGQLSTQIQTVLGVGTLGVGSFAVADAYLFALGDVVLCFDNTQLAALLVDKASHYHFTRHSLFSMLTYQLLAVIGEIIFLAGGQRTAGRHVERVRLGLLEFRRSNGNGLAVLLASGEFNVGRRRKYVHGSK